MACGRAARRRQRSRAAIRRAKPQSRAPCRARYRVASAPHVIGVLGPLGLHRGDIGFEFVAGVERQQRAADRGRSPASCEADIGKMRHGVGGAQRFDIDEVEPERHRDRDGAAGVGREVAHQGPRELPHLHRRQHGIGGGEHAKAEHEAALGVALEIAELGQRVGQPRHRRPRQAGMGGEFGIRERAGTAAKGGEHVEPVRQRRRKGRIGLPVWSDVRGNDSHARIMV